MYGKEMYRVVFVSRAGLFAHIEYPARDGKMKVSIVPEGFLTHCFGDVYEIDSYYLFGEEREADNGNQTLQTL